MYVVFFCNRCGNKSARGLFQQSPACPFTGREHQCSRYVLVTKQSGLCYSVMINPFLSVKSKVWVWKCVLHLWFKKKKKWLWCFYFYFLLAGSHYVPVCEIISVQETEEDCPSTDTGKWQKVPQSVAESNQHAFTGMHAPCSVLKC